jgi:signal transduction histidine kinase
VKSLFLWATSSTRNKLVLAFALFVIPFSVTQMVFIERSAMSMEQQLIITVESDHRMKMNLLDEALTSIMSTALLYQNDRLLAAGIKNHYSAPIESYDLYELIWNRSQIITSVYPGIRKIILYTDNPSLVKTIPYVQRTDEFFAGSTAYQAIDGGAHGYWGSVRRVPGGKDYWMPETGGDSTRMLSYTVPLAQKGVGSPYSGYLTVAFAAERLDVILGGNTQIISAIVDRDNVPVDPDSGIAALVAFLPGEYGNVSAWQFARDSEDFLLWVTPLANGWKLVSAASINRILEGADDMRRLGASYVLLFGLVYVGMVLLISNQVLKRSKELAQKMEAFRAENWEPTEPLKGNDEISIIDRAFFDMGHKLNESIRQNYLQEIAKKQAELSRLHTQIRPHFLYNMLSSIAWIIDDQPRPVARQAVENLASFYRYSLANGHDIIALKDELRIVNAYIELQLLRFKGKISFICQVDDMFDDVKIPRMTLQALVENSIIHGPGDERRPITMMLSAEVSGGKAVLTLADDGVGLSLEKLQQAKEGFMESTSGTGLGYKTINERIQLYFSPEYGLDIFSEQGKGTRICVYIPLSDE